MYGDPRDDETTSVRTVHCDVLFKQRSEDGEVDALCFRDDLF